MQSCLKCFTTIFLILISWSVAMGHGGDGKINHDESKKEKSKKLIRVKPKEIGLLSNKELAFYKDEKKVIPKDIAIISCSIQGLVQCRGLNIVLLDSHGHVIKTSNTGMTGAIGFQGLNPEKKYFVKLKNKKYEGGSVVAAGKESSLIVQKISQLNN